jgi:uncharacterized protein (TIGR00661 family)
MLLEKNCQVVIAGSGESLALLRAEFPLLDTFSIPGYNPVYPRSGSMVWKMITQIPKFISVIKSEHSAIEKLILSEQIDLIISDNRYGCWSTLTPCVFITHQNNILMPKRFGWLSGMVNKLNEKYIRKYSSCWIPDFPGDNALVGQLISFGKLDPRMNVEYIGNLSRFKLSVKVEKKYDVAAIFSGPEPQRTLFENKVLNQLRASKLNYIIVRGKVSSSDSLKDPRVIDFLTSHDLQQLIESSEIILARSGYSTIMDLAALRKKAIFIPTPGQTEQEYLARELMKKQIAFSMPQENFDLSFALENARNYYGFTNIPADGSLLRKAIDKVLNTLY